MGIFEHVLATTGGNLGAAERRLDEIDDLLRSIAENPASGVRLAGHLSGWLARHGGRGQLITVVFRSDIATRVIYIALIAFGGRNWLAEAVDRRGFSD